MLSSHAAEALDTLEEGGHVKERQSKERYFNIFIFISIATCGLHFFFFPKEHFSNKYFFGELQSGVLIGLLVGYKSC